MNINFNMKTVVCAVSFLCAGLTHAATVPAGVKLHDVQELVRGNSSEPESLDPSVATGVHSNFETASLVLINIQ